MRSHLAPTRTYERFYAFLNAMHSLHLLCSQLYKYLLKTFNNWFLLCWENNFIVRSFHMFSRQRIAYDVIITVTNTTVYNDIAMEQT